MDGSLIQGAGGHPALASGRPRPRVFRALGRNEPPLEIEVDGAQFRRQEILKHDSWAATALYASDSGSIVCKFNRLESIGGLPMRLLGHCLARREAAMLARLHDLPNVPELCGPVISQGRRLPNAVAHEFIPGHPLGEHERVNDLFFARLQRLIRALHERDVAYVDLHKRENIIVGHDSQPYLVDFQISVALPRRWPGNSPPVRAVLRMLQQSDEYHLEKHFARCRPELCGKQFWDVGENPPWWIALHRLVGTPFRRWRRWLLTQIGVRRGRGRPESEHFVEDALRQPTFTSKTDTAPSEISSAQAHPERPT